MKKTDRGNRRNGGQLPKLLAALALGVVFGSLCPAWTAVTNFLRDAFGTGLRMLVPFIMLAFVTSSIVRAGSGAGRKLLTTVGIALASTVLVGLLALGISGAVLPRLLEEGVSIRAAGSAQADFTAAMPTIVALVTSVVLGLLIINDKAPRMALAMTRFKAAVGFVVSRVIAPLMPVYVFTVIADMVASGRIAALGNNCVKIMAVAVATTMAVMFVLYLVAGLVTRRNPMRALYNMLPAYLAGCGSCSSVASIPYTLRQVRVNGVSDSTAEMVIPFCSGIHHVGSVANLVVYAVGVALLTGGTLSAGGLVQYVLLVAMMSFVTPGIPGGVALASAWVGQTVLGFTPDQYAVVVAVYLALDGVGTACNLTCDGAVAMLVDRLV